MTSAFYIHCTLSHAGKFKGFSSNNDLSIEDLVDLLHSVDHDKVVSSSDAVISDKALAALLDRTMSGSKQDLSSAGATEEAKKKMTVGHSSVFRVIAERDSHGNLINGEDGDGSDALMSSSSGPSTIDSLRLIQTPERPSSKGASSAASVARAKCCPGPSGCETGTASLQDAASSSIFESSTTSFFSSFISSDSKPL